MELFVIRHAEAVPREEGRDDPERPLTPRGRKRWRQSVEGLDALGVGFDRLYHSPWLRAVETADALSTLLEGESVVTQTLATAPGAALLNELSGKCVAVVGHEPWLSELIAWLTAGETSAGKSISLKKGSVAWLEGQARPGKMKLKALMTPKVLRALRRRSWRRSSTG